MRKEAMDLEETLRLHVGTLMRVFLTNERAFPSAEGQMTYSPHVFQAIGFIADTPGCRASDLTVALGLVPTTTSSLLARLSAKGLIARQKNPKDGRAVALYLTEEGQSLYDAIRRQDLRNMGLMLSALETDEQRAFVDLFGRVAHRVAALAEAAAQDKEDDAAR